MREFIINITCYVGMPKKLPDGCHGGGGGSASEVKRCEVVVAKTATEAVKKLRDKYYFFIDINNITQVK